MQRLDVPLAKQIHTACSDTKGSGRRWESVARWEDERTVIIQIIGGEGAVMLHVIAARGMESIILTGL